MKKFVTVLYIVFSAVLLFYVTLPNYDFPIPPSDSVQSKEPADTETPLRRAYFTNYDRTQVLEWYKAQFDYSKGPHLKLPTYLLNYPPEEAQGIIRDQTKSTFLQEIVHPFRETIYINGYEPASDDDKNRIVIDGVRWRQKIIIKFVPTNLIIRFITAILTLVAIPVLVNTFWLEFFSSKKKS